MYKNYWLRRKAIREDVMYIYKTPTVPDIKVDIPAIPAPERRWKRVEIFSQCPQPFLIFKDNGQKCGDWTI